MFLLNRTFDNFSPFTSTLMINFITSKSTMMTMNNLTPFRGIKISSLFILAFLILPVRAGAQDIDFPDCGDLFTFEILVGTPVNELIGVVVDNPVDLLWDFGTTPAPHDGTSFTINGLTVTLPAGSPSPVPETATATIMGEANTAGSHPFSIIVTDSDDTNITCTQAYLLQVRAPIDLVLVLDRSGSMGWAFDGSFSPPPGERRWDALLTGVDVLADELGNLTLFNADRLGLRLFANALIIPPAPFHGGLINMENHLNQLEPLLNPIIPSSTTALGNGILAGRDMLLADLPAHTKAMIVLSDGVQNVGDMVRTTAPNAYTHTNSNQPLAGAGNNISIHTISLGSSGHNPLLMQEIANNNNGRYLNSEAIPSPQAVSDFQTLYSTHLNNILSGNSPQFVDIRSGTFPARGEIGVDGSQDTPATEQTFSVNRGVSSVIVTLLAPTRLEPHFTSITKDGMDLINHATQNHGNGFVSIAIRFPSDAEITSLGGDWTVRAELGAIPREEVPYTMMITVDDHATKPVYSFENRLHKVDDILRLSVSLHRMGDALEDAQVEAIAAKPGDDINDLIARADIDFSVDNNDPNTPDASKLAALLEDPDFVEQITPQDQFLDMQYNATEEAYEASFDGLDVAGVYQVIFRIDAEHEDYGKINRYHKESLYVRFADVDLANSEMSVIVNQEGIPEIHFRPIASNRKLIGSGWGAAMSLDSDQASIQEAMDNGDGSYRIIVDGELRGPGALTIAGESVFSGNLGHLLMCYGPDANIIQRIQCWLISIGLPVWMFWIILILLLVLLWFIFRKVI